jgi:ketosteroid isomerase-like protein
MTTSNMQQIIEDYIAAYNRFDVEGMTRHLHPDIEFRNIAGGEVTHAIMGIEGFKLQAQEAIHYFTQREQRITALVINGNHAEATIDYTGTLAVDLPNGLQAGEQLQLQGRSLFTFEEGQIIRIEDSSD